jgi:hypothetical protein
MKIERRVTIKPNQFSAGWGTLDFHSLDSNDAVFIELREDQIIQLAQELNRRVERIMEQRFEQAKLVVNEKETAEQSE